jgi:hypothetical protein
MATVQYIELMRRLAVKAKLNPVSAAGTEDWAEPDKFEFVTLLNEALEWCWRPENPRMAWPDSISTGTVTVTAGVISWASLGAGDWFNLWTENPRPEDGSPNRARAVQALWDKDGVYPRGLENGATSVFAFFRTAIPVATYVASPGEGSSYATPTVPARLARMIVQYANAQRLLNGDQLERGYKAEREAFKLYEDELSTLLDTDIKMPWMTNAMAI